MAISRRERARIRRLRGGRWGEEEARWVLGVAQASGLPLARFAEEVGLHPQRLWRWRRALARSTRRESAESSAVGGRTRGAGARRGAGALELGIPGGEEASAAVEFAPVVVTGLGRTPAVVVRAGQVEVEILEPAKVEALWLGELLDAVRSPAQGGA